MATIEVISESRLHAMSLVNIESDPDEEPLWLATCTCGVQAEMTRRGGRDEAVEYGVVHIEGAHE